MIFSALSQKVKSGFLPLGSKSCAGNILALKRPVEEYLQRLEVLKVELMRETQARFNKLDSAGDAQDARRDEALERIQKLRTDYDQWSQEAKSSK